MFSKSSLSKLKNRPQGQGKNLLAVRSGDFYGIKIEKRNLETSSFKRGIVSSPNFYFYNNDTKVLIDFTDYKNITSKDDIREFFNLNLTGETLTVEQANWSNSQLSEKKISLNGTYTIDKFENDILFADVVDIDNFDTSVKRYDKNYFLETPNFNILLDSTQNSIQKTIIVNSLGSNSEKSFKFLGVTIGDFIQFSFSNFKYEVSDLYLDEQGKEIIEVIGDIGEQDLTTTNTILTVFVENYDLIKIEDFDNNIRGRCIINLNSEITCVDNQTRLQCECRKNSSSKKIVTFTENQYCPDKARVVKNITAIEQLSSIAADTTNILSSLNNQVSQLDQFRRQQRI